MNQFITAVQLQSNKDLAINTSHIIAIHQTHIYTHERNLHGVEIECIGDITILIQGSVESVMESIYGLNNSVLFNYTK